MGVMVYSRLGDLLRARNLTVDDLQRQIAARFGLAVDARTLDRLARDERVRQPDVEIAAAAATVLGATLNDIFAVEAIPLAEEGTSGVPIDAEDDLLDPHQSHRLQSLFDLRNKRSLSEDEQTEMRALVAEYGRRVHEKSLHEIAERRDLPLEQVRAEVAEDFARRRTWWDEVQADPALLQVLIAEALEQRRAHVGG